VSYSYHTAFLKCTFEFLLMQVLLESCARENRLNSVDCFNDVYSWCHLCRKRFKWCVYKKLFSYFWVEVSEHMNCHHHHAHFVCISSVVTLSQSIFQYVIMNRKHFTFEWLKWLKMCFIMSVIWSQ
jgi:hypothetical protein